MDSLLIYDNETESRLVWFFLIQVVKDNANRKKCVLSLWANVLVERDNFKLSSAVAISTEAEKKKKKKKRLFTVYIV